MTLINEAPPVHAPPRPRWRRRLMIAAATIAIVVAILAGVGWYLDWAEQRDFAEALAETDRLDPGWRLEDIEAARRQIPDEKNGALIVLSARRKMPAKWTPDLDEILSCPPPFRLNEKLAQELRDDLKPVAGVITEARRLVDFPEGRFAITYGPDHFKFSPQHHDVVRTIGLALQLDGWLQLQDGNSNKPGNQAAPF